MKFKKFIAVLCCLSLCGCDDVDLSYNYNPYSSSETLSVTEYEEPYYPETSTVTTAATTTAATTEKPFNGYVPAITKVTIDAEIHMVTVDFEVPSVSKETISKEKYKINIYISDSSESYGRVARSGGIGDFLPLSVHGTGTYYLRVELYNDKYSNISEPYTMDYVDYDDYAKPEQKEEIHQYTHTFSAPEGCVVVADYTSALEEINKGKQPLNYDYIVYFTCPSCGHQITLPKQQFAYDRDSQYITFNVKCGKSNCPVGNKTVRGTIYSYATQIS